MIKLTNQKVFNAVATHLLKQNKRSGFGLKCLYRGPNGLKCAVGVLIPDSIYEKDMESKNAGYLLDNYPAVKKLLAGVSSGLLEKLQSIHDTVPMSQWKADLSYLAENFGLRSTVLKKWQKRHNVKEQ